MSNRKPPQVRATGAEGFLAGKASGWITFHPEVARALARHLKADARGHMQDRDLAVLSALFLAACFRWRGKSTVLGGGWFSKTDRQWCDELAVHKTRLYDIVRFVCLNDSDNKPMGAPCVGLVRRRTGEGQRNNGAHYLIDGERLSAWWLSSGLQPALAGESDVNQIAPPSEDAPEAAPATPSPVIDNPVDNCECGGVGCQACLTTGCSACLTTSDKRLFDDGKLNEKDKAADPKFVLSVLKSAYGDKWQKTLNRNAPITTSEVDRESAVMFLRKTMAQALSNEIEIYHREFWGIVHEDIVFELGLGCALLDLDKRTLEERVGDIVLKENRGLTQRNPTGVYINRLRGYMAKIAKLEMTNGDAGGSGRD